MRLVRARYGRAAAALQKVHADGSDLRARVLELRIAAHERFELEDSAHHPDLRCGHRAEHLDERRILEEGVSLEAGPSSKIFFQPG
jgi:hypothetical protein